MVSATSMANASPPLRTAIVGALIFVLSFAWLSLAGAAPLHGDSCRDLLFARDLAEGNALHEHGVPTAFAKFVQGTSWIDLLALARRLELSIVEIERLLRALISVAVAVGVVGLARLLGRRPDDPGLLGGGAVFLATLPWLCELPILWQPQLLPLPAVLVHLALWRSVLDGRAIDAALVGLFVGWAIDVHVVAVLLIVPCGLAIVATSKRPVLATSAAASAGLGFLALSSRATLRDNFEFMRREEMLEPALFVLGIGIIVGVLARRRILALAPERRLALVTGVELVLVALLLAAPAFGRTPDLSPRYLLPFAPVLLLVVALRFGTTHAYARPRVRAALLAALALAMATRCMARVDPTQLPDRPRWLLRELEPLAEVVAEHGYDWPLLVEHLQGSVREATLAAFAVFEREPDEVSPPVDEDLIFIGLPDVEADEVERLVPAERILAEVPLEGGRALLLRMPARLRRAGAMVRFEGGALGPDTSRLRGVSLVPPPSLVHQMIHRAYPAAWEADGRLHLEGDPDRVVWRLRFEAGSERVVSLVPFAASPACTWQVDGVELEGEPMPESPELPWPSVVLPAGRSGWIELGRTITSEYGARDCLVVQDDGVLPPGTIETEPDQRALREALWLKEPRPLGPDGPTKL